MDPYTKTCLLAHFDEPSLWRESKEGKHLLGKTTDGVFLDKLRYFVPTDQEVLGVAGMGVFNELGFRHPFSERQAHSILRNICQHVDGQFYYRLGQIVGHLSKRDLETLVQTNISPPSKDQDFFKENLKNALCHKIGQQDPESVYCASLMVELARKWLSEADTNEMHFYYLIGTHEDPQNLDKALDLDLDAERIFLMRKTIHKLLRQAPTTTTVRFSGTTWTGRACLDFLKKAHDKWGRDALMPDKGWFKLYYLDSFENNVSYYEGVCEIFGLRKDLDIESLSNILEIDFTSIVDGEDYCKACLRLGSSRNTPLSFSFSPWNKEYLGLLYLKKKEVLETWNVIQEDEYKDVVPDDFKLAVFCLLTALRVDRLPQMQPTRFFDFPQNTPWDSFVSDNFQFGTPEYELVERFKQMYDQLKLNCEIKTEVEASVRQKKTPTFKKM